MHFPKHWKLVYRGGVCAWGWSDESLQAAVEDGEKRVQRITEWLQGGSKGERGGYGYPDRPMREPVLREFHVGDKLSAAVSRNSYGCEVLNTSDAMFVDVDAPQGGVLAAVAALFRGGKFEPALLAKVERWLVAEPSWGWRVYRTRAGIRLLATHAPVAPQDPACQRAFKWFGADRLYQKLCVDQKCFRARLTPKPWRCGGHKPPARWPFADAAAEAQFVCWQREYGELSRAWATCQLVGQFGNGRIHPELEALVGFHDEATRANVAMPLA